MKPKSIRLQKKLYGNNFLERIGNLELDVMLNRYAPNKVRRLEELSEDLGDIVAGRFIAADNSSTEADPTATGFRGAWMSASGETFPEFPDDTWLLGASDSGTLNFGVRASDGSVYTRGDYLRVIERLQGFANFNGNIRCLAYDATNGYIYIGGEFTKINGTTYNRIVRFNLATSTFTAMSTGIANGAVLAMAVADDGTLYLGGTFTNAGGDANADLFAKWNGSAFSACGTAFAGASTSVNALVMASDGVTVYIGGNFTDIGDANGDYITSWNGSAYASLATGLNGALTDLDVDSSGNLYVVGSFTDAGGDANADRFAMWNGVAFAALGTAFAGSTATMWRVFVDADDNIYVTGNFTNIGDANGDYIVRWDGSAYSSLGTGIPSPITSSAVALAATSDYIYVGGSTGTSAFKRFVISTSTWETVGVGLYAPVYDIIVIGNDVFVGGGFYADASAETPQPQFVKWGAVNLKDVLDYLLRAVGSSSVVMGFSTDESVPATSTRYANPYTSAMRAASQAFIMPRAGYLRNWRFETRTAQSANNSMTVTLEVNGVAVMTVVVAQSDTAQVYSDTTTVAFANAGDTVQVKFVNAANAASATVVWSSWEFL